MSGKLGDLSPAQAVALSEFRERLSDVMQPEFDDYYLLKWLRARSFDLNKSELMLRKNLAWRKEHDVDEIFKWEAPEVLNIYYPGGLFGYTRAGLPLWIEPAGDMDPKGLLHSSKKSDIIKLKIQHCEVIQRELKIQSKKQGRRVDNIVVICDFEHYGLKHFWRPAIDIFKEVLNIFEPHYPETVLKTYIINANRFFSVLFNIAKPFISEDTRSKVIMLGNNWRRELHQEIDPDQLPVRWGGTCTDPDGDISCRSRIAIGGQVPERYRLPKHDLYEADKLTKVTVARGAKHEVEFTANQPHCILVYQFYTENHDIGFGVYRRTVDNEQETKGMEQIRSTSRANSHMVQEDGSVKLVQPGTYVLVFDNSFSWIKSKKVVYNIQVLPPYDIRDLQHSRSYQLADDTDIIESTHL